MPQVPPPKRHPYDQWSPDARALDLVGDKWTLLIVRDLAAGPRRFVELQRVLPGISTEQLRSRLNRMVADGMLTRKRYREVPPRVDYELTERARDLMPVLAELARWGYQWAWSEPRQNERVDVGAILRLIPGLVEPGDAAGQLELNVVGGGRDGETVSYTVSLSGGRATVTERGVEQADARISGDVDAWIKAFAPTPDRRGLQVDGNADLAELLLTGLASSAAATPEDGTTAAGTAAAGTAAAGTAAAGTAAAGTAA